MRRDVVFNLLVLLFGSLTACSPGNYFGTERDGGLGGSNPKREVSVQCQGLDLSGPEIGAQAFRKLIACWNDTAPLIRFKDW